MSIIFDPSKFKEFGYNKSPNDYRDYMYGLIKGNNQVPKFHYLNKLWIRDQGIYGTCVGQAAAYIKDYQESINHPGRQIKTSPLFNYAECKKIDGIPNKEGTYPRISMKVMHDKGMALESTVPYNLLSDKIKMPSIPQKAYEEAPKYKIGAYARINTLQEIKQAIAIDNNPVMIGILVAENFMEPEKGFVNLPKGYILGGHAMALDGYNDDLTFKYKDGTVRKGFVRVANSWGTSWGDGGWGWIPYDYFYFEPIDLPGFKFWDESWTSVDIITPSKSINEIILKIDSEVAYVDGQKVILDEPPTINPKTERTLIPLRFLSEALGFNIHWNGVNKTIRITKR